MSPVWGRFFDGERGERLDVELSLDRVAETLKLTHPDLPHGSQYWPFRAIRMLADQARTDQITLSLYDDGALDSALIKTARLVVDDAQLIDDLRARCRNLNRRDLRRGVGRKIATRTVGAVAALAVIFFFVLPTMSGVMAALIPLDREIAMGRSVVNQMERFLGGDGEGSLLCSAPDGLDALETMRLRLTENTPTAYDLDIVVFDHGMVNAFAAPGGQIVIMRGLLQKADSADEVAAVLAHEIGHVESRDVTRNALRTAGSAGLLSMILGDVTGGSAVVIMAEFTLRARYTREAEAEADQYALAMLEAADVNAQSMANFFAKLSALEARTPDIPLYLRSHPKSDSRAAIAQEAADGQRGTSPVISDRDWRALQAVCAEPEAD